MTTVKIIRPAIYFAIISCFIFNHTQASAQPEPMQPNHKKCIILLHGLGRTHKIMQSLEHIFRSQGYVVVNEDYDSVHKHYKRVSEEDIPGMLKHCEAHHTESITFITHSLGGLVAQEYIQNHTLPKLTHLIMMAPPNHGSPIADRLTQYPFFKWWYGPSLSALTTQRQPYKKNPSNHYTVCIIAGNKPQPILSSLFFGDIPNDGKVSVQSSYLDDADQFDVLTISHTWMPNKPEVHHKIFKCLGINAS